MTGLLSNLHLLVLPDLLKFGSFPTTRIYLKTRDHSQRVKDYYLLLNCPNHLDYTAEQWHCYLVLLIVLNLFRN